MKNASTSVFWVEAPEESFALELLTADLMVLGRSWWQWIFAFGFDVEDSQMAGYDSKRSRNLDVDANAKEITAILAAS